MKNNFIKLSNSQMFAILAELEFVDRELSHELQDLFVEALYLGPQQSHSGSGATKRMRRKAHNFNGVKGEAL
jgi:hypothetical protein